MSAEGFSIVGENNTRIASYIRNWHAAKSSVSGRPMSGDRMTFAVMARDSGSRQRTHAGILVDYTIWLAGYGIEPGSINDLAKHLNQTKKNELRRGLDKARKLAESRKLAQAAGERA